MSQIEATTVHKRTRSRWVWILLTFVVVVPVVMLLVAIRTYMSMQESEHRNLVVALEQQRRVAEQNALLAAEAQALQRQNQSAHAQIGQKTRSYVARIEAQFDGLETRTANAVIVERLEGKTYLVAAAETLSPVTAKVNGRIMTRYASSITMAWSDPMGMAGAGPAPLLPGSGAMGMSAPGMMSPTSMPLMIASEIPSSGLVVLSTVGQLSPIRIMGEFPRANLGEKLTVVSPQSAAGTPSELTVLAVDDVYQPRDGQRVEHVLKLSESGSTESGSLLCNSQGQPIGVVISIGPAQGQARLTFALPMERVFQAFYGVIPAPGSISSEAGLRDGAGLRPEAFDFSIGVAKTPAVDTRSTLESKNTPPPLIVDSDPVVQEPGPVEPAEMKVYQVQGFPPNIAETIQKLFGKEARVAADGTGESVIVVAPNAVQKRVGAAIAEMNDRAQIVKEERRKVAEVEKEKEQIEAEKNRKLMDQALEEVAARDAAAEADHRRNPKRTRSIKATGRDPKEVAALLTKLFGEKADVAIDETSGNVLITINRAQTWAEVQFLLAEIEATATKLTEGASTSPLGPRGALPLPGAMNPALPLDQTDEGLEQETRKLAMRLRAAPAAEQLELRKELERLAERHFNLRQENRKREIDELGGRVDKLKQLQQRREQNKSDIIQKRIRDLTDPDADLRWDEARNGTKKPLAIPLDQLKPATSAILPDVGKPIDNPAGLDPNVVESPLEERRPEPGDKRPALEDKEPQLEATNPSLEEPE